MHLNDFHFNLPESLIARYPLANRSDSRLLYLPFNAAMQHKQFKDIIHFISPKDLLIFNNTKVMKARLIGKKITGGKVELLIERILNDKEIIAQLRVSKPPAIQDVLEFDIFRFQVLEKKNQFYKLSLIHSDFTISSIIELIGQLPIPPYMGRLADKIDEERYQTVYAKKLGSVAAPTAGLHFDEEVLKELQYKKVEIAELTLHIGAGTFLPVRHQQIEAHHMHAEYVEISAELIKKIKSVRERGGRIIAVGTTSLRALETLAEINHVDGTYRGETDIFIYPGFTFQIVDVLITNFHLPCTTLLMLVSAFGGHEKVMQAYQQAVQLSYRFYSYGDAMWLEKAI